MVFFVVVEKTIINYNFVF